MIHPIESRIRARLEELELPVSGLAQRMRVSRVALYHLFKGRYSREMLDRVSKTLGIPVHVLLTPLEFSKGSADSRLLEAYEAATPEVRGHVDDVLRIPRAKKEERKPVAVVVDDLQDNVDLVKRCLQKEFTVLEFTDPFQALLAIQRQPVDVIISDQRMPQMTGTQFLERVNQSRPNIAKLIVSAYTDNDAFIQAINEARVDAFLLKPFRPSELRDRVRSLLSAQRIVTTFLH